MFDAEWRAAAAATLRTFRERQRKDGPGPYSFRRTTSVAYDTVPLGGYGNPARPVGLILSGELVLKVRAERPHLPKERL